jgi:hypothetical protein
MSEMCESGIKRPCEVDMCDRFVEREGEGKGQNRHCVRGGMYVVCTSEFCSRGGDSDDDGDTSFLCLDSSSLLLRSRTLSAGCAASYCSCDSAGKPAIRRLKLVTLLLLSFLGV